MRTSLNKYCKNCQYCLVSLFIVRSWFKVLNCLKFQKFHKTPTWHALSLSYCWSRHVFSSLWSNVSRVISFWDCSLEMFFKWYLSLSLSLSFSILTVGVKSKLAMIIVVSSEEGLRKKFRHRFKATRRLTRIVLSGCNGVKKEEDERFHQSNWSTGYRYRCWLIMFSFRWRGKLNSRTYIQYMSKLPLPANQRDQNKGQRCFIEAFEIAVRVGGDR